MYHYNIHDIVTIRAAEPILWDAFDRYFRVDRSEIDGDPDIVIDTTRCPDWTGDSLYRHDNWFYGAPGRDLVYYNDRLFGQRDAVGIEGLDGPTTRIYADTIDRPDVTPRSRGSVSDLIECVIDYKFLQRGFTTLHAASLCKDGRAILLGGFPNVGKTLSTLGLLQDGWQYMGDDNGVIGEGGRVYAHPSTSSIGYHDFIKYIDPESIGRRRYYRHLARVWPMQNAIIERLADYPEVYLPDIGFEQGDIADGAIACTLEIGERRVTDVSADTMATKLLAATDGSRPRIWQNPLLQVWAYFNDQRFATLQAREFDILESFLDGVDCYTLACQFREWRDVLSGVSEQRTAQTCLKQMG